MTGKLNEEGEKYLKLLKGYNKKYKYPTKLEREAERRRKNDHTPRCDECGGRLVISDADFFVCSDCGLEHYKIFRTNPPEKEFAEYEQSFIDVINTEYPKKQKKPHKRQVEVWTVYRDQMHKHLKKVKKYKKIKQIDWITDAILEKIEREQNDLQE